jgi:hypothetical protein
MDTVMLFTEWQEEYAQRRYLKHDSIEQLNQRQKDLEINILTIGADGSAVIDVGEDFRRRLAHVHTEFKLRNLPIPTEIRQAPYRYFKRAAELWAGVTLEPGTYLLKFGNHEHLLPMLKNGKIRVGNAKMYDDPSLNSAIADRETEFVNELYGATIGIPLGKPYARTEGITQVEPIGNVRRIAKCNTDYHIASFCLKYDFRLFDDFSRESEKPYDSCLVIRDPHEFINRMRTCGESKLSGWSLHAQPVVYSDPYQPERGPVDVFFTKHFRYAYQEEFRMVWIPPSPQDKLEPINFVLGPMTEYCTLLTL